MAAVKHGSDHIRINIEVLPAGLECFRFEVAVECREGSHRPERVLFFVQGIVPTGPLQKGNAIVLKALVHKM